MKLSHVIALLTTILAFCSTLLHAQCSISASLAAPTDPAYKGAGLQIISSGGVANGAVITLFRDGIQFLQSTRSNASGPLNTFFSFQCFRAGDYTWTIVGTCQVIDEEGRTVAGKSALTTGGPYTVPLVEIPPTFQAQLLNPAQPTGNVAIDFAFPPGAGDIRSIRIEPGLSERKPSEFAGQWIVNLAPGQYTLTMRWCTINNTRESQIPFTVPAPPQTTLQVRNLTLASPAVTKPFFGTVTATIPLGTRFSLALQKPNGTSVKANCSLGPAQFDSAVFDPALYPSDLVLEYDRDTDAEEKVFEALHLGRQDVVITPLDSSLGRQVVTLRIVEPLRLGDTHHVISAGSTSYDLDSKIVEWSHRRGIPPQIIKGIMKAESSPAFNPKTWRYEPLATDYDEFSPQGANHRQDTIYEPYRMEYDAQHPRGVLLVDSEDVHPRSVFYLDKAAKTKIPDGEQDVTAYTIYMENDSWQNWLANLGSGPKKQAIIQDPKAVLDWSAQTTLAASYGLMQVLFEESFNFGFPGIRGQRRPYYLFDVPPNVQAGGGSVQTGSGLLVQKFRFANRASAPAPQFTEPKEFDDAYRKALSAYNGSRKRGGITKYGGNTFNNAADYPPIPATPIFN